MAIETVKAKDSDRIIFLTNERKEKTELLKALNEAKGIWKKHPVFGKMNISQIIEYLRGEDSEI
ncbi:MAG: hypothetical protein COS84_07790 [Armatimonadetes bacterium CG07_land_8_20_14_0_80_40_9]|nr:MAG: hypothetical protein COS84_07790 [Armatimonadetes bacterium CG07_land_8_20_14_0_80_40_9]